MNTEVDSIFNEELTGEEEMKRKERESNMEHADLPEWRPFSVPYAEAGKIVEEQILIPEKKCYCEILFGTQSDARQNAEENNKPGNDKIDDCNDNKSNIAANLNQPYTDWSELEIELLIEGLRRYGRNFETIKNIAFPKRDLKNIIEYYYSWKWAATLEQPIKRGDDRFYVKKQEFRTSDRDAPPRISRSVTRSLGRDSIRALIGEHGGVVPSHIQQLSVEEKVRRIYANFPHTNGSPPRAPRKPFLGKRKTEDSKKIEASTDESNGKIEAGKSENNSGVSKAKAKKTPAKTLVTGVKRRRSQRRSKSVYARHSEAETDEQLPSTIAGQHNV